MAKQLNDRTTIDLFAEEKRPGRPKTNPLSREAQLKINKRNQLKRDRESGLKRVELKLHEEFVSLLDEQAKAEAMSRAAYIEKLLRLAAHK
ncbi:LexA regulated protein [Echinimonas agarilytica]|uniref:LexA regulated protein n=1 Tax=Echinimonas agarilytica TaxID=1215918 RepID=A0AA41W8B5_9GAMM|nr:LexA regulated protein [Echinimonas agarilytica]MCM2680795.1 LexA regulated protein [Echinimonas agarilytica]